MSLSQVMQNFVSMTRRVFRDRVVFNGGASSHFASSKCCCVRDTKKQRHEDTKTFASAQLWRAVQEAQWLCCLEVCRAVLLDRKLSPLSVDDQVALKEHADKLKLPPESLPQLLRTKAQEPDQKKSKMLPEKLLKITKEMLLYPLGRTGLCWSRCSPWTACEKRSSCWRRLSTPPGSRW